MVRLVLAVYRVRAVHDRRADGFMVLDRSPRGMRLDIAIAMYNGWVILCHR